jgi:alcohol dehydrogenase class IV
VNEVSQATQDNKKGLRADMADTAFAQLAEFYCPTKIVFGIGASSRIAEEVRALGGTKALIVTDKVLSELKVLRPLLESLDSAGVAYAIFDEVRPGAPVRLIHEALRILQSQGCDLVIGFGGGSPMDTAKCVSLLATNGPDVRAIVGAHKVGLKGTPKIVVPTTNVAGADTGLNILVTLDEETHEKNVIRSRYSMADVVINDPLLTVSMPPAVTADTGIDVLGTGIECMTSPHGNLLANPYAEKVVEWSARYLPQAYANGSNLEARYYMAASASMSGLAYMSSLLGLVHALSYPVAARCELTHGRSMAPVMRAVMRYNLPGCPEKFCRVAELMGECTDGLSPFEGGSLAISAVERLFDAIDVPYRLRDYGVAESDIRAMAESGFPMAKERFSQGNPRDFNVDDLEAILRAAF